MRYTILLIFICSVFTTKATNYYFSSISGDDNRTSLQSQNPNTPWQTIAKLNSIFPTLLPGDSILFKRGETYNGLIEAAASGSPGFPIVLSAYGTGSKPIISGFKTLQNWSTAGNGIWEALCAECGSKVNVVTVDETLKPMGRYPNLSAPNKGYLTIDATNGTNQIIDNDLPGTPNWNGGELVIRKTRWIIDRNVITSHTGSTINFTSGSTYPPKINYGYFIQNHLSTLDQDGEWYYDSTQKKIKIYFASSNPNGLNIKASRSDLLVYSEANNIIFDNLAFNGANVEAFEIYYATNFQIKNCDISFVGFDGIYAENTTGFTFENNSIQDVNNNAVYMTNNCSNSVLRGNLFRRTAINPGAGYSDNDTYQAISIYGDGNLLEYNQIDSTGYNGIRFNGNNVTIKNNFINYFTLIKDDGGAIYSWTGEQDPTIFTGRKITGNVILNGKGCVEGTDNSSYIPSEGIYMDDNSKNVEISNNTVAYCNQSGMLLHNSANLEIRDNTFFENNRQWLLIHDNISPNSPLRNLILKRNILFSKSATNLLSDLRTIKNDVTQFGVFDSNYYCRHLNQNAIISVNRFDDISNSFVNESHNLNSWQVNYGKDPASQVSPAIAGDSIIFEYNSTSSIKTIALNGKFIDVKNNQFSGTLNINPYSSVILIKKPANCNNASWLGTVSSSWHNPANWSCGVVPDETTNVTVGTGTAFECTIGYAAICKSLTFSPGAVVRANKNLVIKTN